MIFRRRLYRLARLCLHETDGKPSGPGISQRTRRHLSSAVAVNLQSHFLCKYHQAWIVTPLRKSMSTGPHLRIQPEGHLLMDDVLELKISDLDRHQKTTLHATIREGNALFESVCCFTADENGEVNLATQPSLEGSYTGVSGCRTFCWLITICILVTTAQYSLCMLRFLTNVLLSPNIPCILQTV